MGKDKETRFPEGEAEPGDIHFEDQDLTVSGKDVKITPSKDTFADCESLADKYHKMCEILSDDQPSITPAAPDSPEGIMQQQSELNNISDEALSKALAEKAKQDA